MDKIPVHIISGFLGAGKTTAIIQFLTRKPADESWAIIINEFGKISIDGQILQSESSEGSVFEISGGCICCSARGYFQENLEKITLQDRFNRILIEPSGLGGIDHITELVREHPALHLMPVVCIVDITMTKHPGLRMLLIYKAQIQQADLILFSKTELVEENELIEMTDQFSADFPGKSYARQSGYDEIFLSSVKKNQHPVQNDLFGGFYPVGSGNKDNYQEYCLKIKGSKAIDRVILTELLKNEPAIVRAKGYIYTGNEWQLFNYTLTGFSTVNCRHRTENELVIIYNTAEMPDIQSFKFRIETL